MGPLRRRIALWITVTLGLSLGLGGAIPPFATPGTAAHAFLKRTQPANGSVAAPSVGQVRLTFTERVEVRPDRVAVTDGAGRRIDFQNAYLAPDDATTVVVAVPSLETGIYTVEYAFFSADTHTIAGSFRFGVGVSPAEVLAAATTAPPTSVASLGVPALLEALGRWLNLLSLVLLAGPIAFRLVVLASPLQRGRSAGNDHGHGPPATVLHLFATRAVRWAWIAVGVLVAAQGVGLVAASVASSLGTVASALTPGALGATLASRFGTLWLGRLGLLLVPALVLPLIAAEQDLREAAATPDEALPPSRWSTNGWWAILAAGASLTLLTALGGHAATTAPVALSLLIDWVHLVAMILWIGGLFSLAVLLPPILRSLGAVEGNRVLASVAPRFSTLATLSVQALVLTGLYQTWAQVGEPRVLTATGYGRTLLVKLALVVPLIALGAVNRALIVPRLQRLSGGGEGAGEGDRERARASGRSLRRLVWGETALGVAVLLVVGLLTTLPPARESAAVAAGADDTTAANGVGAAANEVTLAANAGELLVTLRIGPAENGPAVLSATVQDAQGTAIDDATVRLRLVPPDGGAPQDVPLVARNGRYLGLGDLERDGRWQIEASVAAREGAAGTALFGLSLPTGGARPLLAAADAAMNRLTALRERQILSSGGSSVTMDFEFATPDRLRLKVSGGSETGAVGTRRFDRAPGGQWLSSSWPAPGGYRWPEYAHARTASEVTILGREDVDGEPCWIVAFLDNESGARFTFWIGERDSLVRRQRMFATGHYMESRFYDFNAPITIEAPE